MSKTGSAIPVKLTVGSDIEPVELCDGIFTEKGNGFAVEFKLGDAQYVFSHDGKNSGLAVSGLMTYSIDFAAPALTKLKTPFGDMEFFIEPTADIVTRTQGGIEVCLSYKITAGGKGEERTVRLSLEF